MYVPPSDRSTDPEEWRSFVAAQGFGHLVAVGAGRDRAVVVPTQFVLDGDTVLLHFARPNPVWEAVAENPVVTLSVAGDWAFVPSSWKAIGDDDPRFGIPTTYYGAVQLTGSAVVLDDAADIAAILRAMTARLQPDDPIVDPLEHGHKLRAIRGMRISVHDVAAKFKYGGNVDIAHREAVVARLLARDAPGDRAAAAHVRRRSAVIDGRSR